MKLFSTIAILLFAFMVLMPTSSAFADATGGDTDSSVQALQQICGGNMQTSDGKLHVFSVAVPCFETILTGLAESSIQKFSMYLHDIVYSILVCT